MDRRHDQTPEGERPAPSESLARLRRLVDAVVLGASEMALAILLVLGLGVVFLGILVLSFPRGTGLVDFYGELIDRDRGRSRGVARPQSGDTDGEEVLAVLSRVTRSVRTRPADAVAWHNAGAGLSLTDRHTVQTLQHSGAQIAFSEDSELVLEENTLIVIKRPENPGRAVRRRPSLVLLDGRVGGRVATVPSVDGPLDIVTAGGSTRIRADAGTPAEFSVKVNADRTSTFSLFSGAAEVTSAGSTTSLQPNQALTLTPSLPPGRPVSIPGAPLGLEPGPGARLTVGAVAPRVRFAWQPARHATTYRLEIARDPEFAVRLYVAELAGTSFVYDNIEPGRYCWRVTGLNGPAEGAPGVSRCLDVERDLEPPRLRVELPAQGAGAGILVVRGETEPGAELFIADAAVRVGPDGRFEHTLPIRPGLSMIVVESIDAAGNSSYFSQYVNVKPETPGRSS